MLKIFKENNYDIGITIYDIIILENISFCDIIKNIPNFLVKNCFDDIKNLH